MEDAATAEISRAQVWQWLRHGAPLDDGRAITPALYAAIRDEELASVRRQVGETAWRSGRFERAAALFDELSTSETLRGLPDPARLRRAHRHGIESRVRRPMKTARDSAVLARDLVHGTALDGHRAPVLRRGRRPPARLARDRAHARRAGRRAPLGAAPHASRTSPRSARSPATRRCSRSRAGLKAIYLSRLAGRGRRQPRRADVPRPEPLSRRQSSRTSCSGSTRRCSAPTRSSTPRARTESHWFAPIVADAEAGFGGPLNAFELMKAMIEAGAAGVHFEDQLASREEVRPHGRQGARPDQRSSSAR